MATTHLTCSGIQLPDQHAHDYDEDEEDDDDDDDDDDDNYLILDANNLRAKHPTIMKEAAKEIPDSGQHAEGQPFHLYECQ